MNYFFKIYLGYLKPKLTKVRAVFSSLFLLLLVVSIDFGLANIHKNSSLEREERNESCGTVTDIDGNVYETVMVAGECWIKSNLKVKHYRNGDPIPEIQNQQEWVNTRAGAWCYYDNDPANEEKYGLLYNFYAVTDPRGLAPEGWEVPPICTYQNLMNYYGYNKSADKIKDPNEWPPHFNTNPDNESGLTVIPSGIRTDQFGGSMFQGNSPNQYTFGIWTRSSFDLNIGFNAFSTDNAPFFNLAYFSKLYGLSVRTTKIKDPPQDPLTLIPEEFIECSLKNVRTFMSDFPALVDRPYCLNSPLRDEYWNDSYLCYDLDRVKIYKANISSEPMRLEDRFEYDVPYYFLMGNISSFDFGRTVETCNIEYKAIIFKKPIISAPLGESEQSFCRSAKISDLSVSGENLVWYDEPEAGNALNANTILEDGKFYYASKKPEGCEIAERLRVKVNVQTSDAPTGLAVQEFCYGALIEDLVAEGNNLVWLDSEGNTLTPLDNLVDNKMYRAVSKVGACESGALEVKVVIKSTPSPVAASTQQLCMGSLLSDISIEGTMVELFDNEDSTIPVDKETPIDFGKSYYASQIINGCSSKERVKINLEPKIISPPIADEVQVFCNKANISDLVIDGINIRWYKDEAMTEEIGPNHTLQNGAVSYVTQTVNGCQGSPKKISVVINKVDKPIGEAVQEFCGMGKVSDLQATGRDILWFRSVNDTEHLNIGDQLVDGGIYYASQTVEGCESPEKLEVLVNVFRPQLPQGEILQKVCEGSTISDLVVDGVNIIWYKDVQGPEVLGDDMILENGFTYYVSQSIGGCESGRFGVMVEIEPSLNPIAEGIQSFCESFQPKVKDLFAVGEKVLWYRTGTEVSPLPDEEPLQDGIIYYASNFNTLGCESSFRTPVEVSVNVCEVEVFNLVTLDGNNKNAYFKIKDIEHFPNNRLEIFNRYGVLVYAMNGYGQDERYFYGESNMNNIPNASNGLPTGNYLYILTYRMPIDEKVVKVSGYLHLINANSQKR